MPDANLSAADRPLASGLLAAAQPEAAYRAPEDLRAPISQDMSGALKSADRVIKASGQTPSGPSGIGNQIASSVDGPLTPDLGIRSGVRPEFVPVINWISKGESHGYNELYNGKPFSDMSDHPSNLGWAGDYGPDGRHTSAAGLLQWEQGTWNQARNEYNALHPNDPVHDFSDVSQNKVGQYWIDKTYREKTGGRDIIKDLAAGKTDLLIPALRDQWPSLDKGGERDRGGYGFSGGVWGRELAEESRRNTASELAMIERDRHALLDEMAKEAPGSAKRMQMLEEAHAASKRATELYEKQMKTPPAYQPTDVFAGIGGIFMALAAFAGGRAAQPLTASLNAMSGAMDGMNQSNHEAFDRNFAVWNKQTDYALKLVGVQNQEIRDILEDQRLAEGEKQQKLLNTYRLFEMDHQAAAAQRGDLQTQWQHLESSERLANEGKRLAAEAQHWDEARRHNLAIEQQKAGGGIQDVPDTEIDYWSRVITNGGTFPPGLSRTAAGSNLVRAVMKNMAESGDPDEFIANIATKKADATSLSNMTRMADAATSFERTASQNFDLALKLSKDAVPTDWGPWLNKFIETAETQEGNKDVPPYVAAMLTAANEYAKIMSGSTGAQGSTVDSRREAAELFSPYLSAGQIDRVVAVAKRDMANRKQSLYGQIDDIKSRLRVAGSKEPTATLGQTPQAGAPALEVTPEEYEKLPSGSGYRVPGNPAVMFKP